MPARITDRSSDAIPTPDATSGSETLPELLVSLTFAPATVDLNGNAAQEAGIWILAEQLAPAERLTIALQFGREGRFRIVPELRLETLMPNSGTVRTAPSLHQPAIERAAALALPGFVSSPLSATEEAKHRINLLPPWIDAFGPDQAPSARPVLADVALTGFDSLRVPVAPAAQPDVQAVVDALTKLDAPVTLELTLSRFVVDAPLLRLLERADEALCVQIYRNANGLLDTLNLAGMRSWLEDLRRTGAGLRLIFALASAAPVSADLAALVGRILHRSGADHGQPAPRQTLTDLRGTIPLSGHRRPRLLPDSVRLAEYMLSSRPRPAAPSATALLIGRDAAERPVAIGGSDRARHIFMIGGTGVGKSTLLANMILQDAAHGRGIILVDPHGDLHSLVLDALPSEARERVINADAGNFAQPFGLNLLEITGEPAAVQRNFIANQLVGIFQSILYRGVPEAFGPMFAAYFRNALFLLMDVEGPKASLAEFDRIFAEPSYRRSLLDRCSDPQVIRFWKDIAHRAGGEAALENIAPYICSKLTQFTGNPLLAPIITAPRTTLDIPGAMASGGIVLVNLAKGLIGEHDAALLGGLITIRIFCAALARTVLPQSQRAPVTLYLDEFATYATGTLSQMLAECRKFGLELVLAGQSLDQVDGRSDRPDVAHAILANVGSILAFRSGPNDAHRLAHWFGPGISAATLARLPDHRLIARLLQDGVPGEATHVWTEGFAVR